MARDRKGAKNSKKGKTRGIADAAAVKPGTPTPPAPGGAASAELPPIEGPLRAMVIMAHPDDAEFLCSGTIAKWCAEGWDVIYVLATGGDKGTHDPEMHQEKLAAIREAEQRAACKVLGVRECVLLGYPDGFTDDDHEFRGQVVRLLRLYKPDVVVTWDAFRGTFNHRDHRTVGTVVSDAIYPLVRDRLFYPAHEDDGLESHQVNEVLLAGADKPDHTVDITAHWETKVDAILCHVSQVGGRTKEDFVKERAEREKANPGQPIEERFRRWSIRRPARPTTTATATTSESPAQEPAAATAGTAVHAVAKGQKGNG